MAKHPHAGEPVLTCPHLVGGGAFAECIVSTVPTPLLVLDGELRVVVANAAFLETFQVAAGETEGRPLYALGGRQWDLPRLRDLLGRILPERTAFEDVEVTVDFPPVGRRALLLNARPVARGTEPPRFILLAIEDVTERRRAEADLRESHELLARIFDNTHMLMAYLDAEMTFVRVNRAYAEAGGHEPAYFIGKNHFDLYPHEENEAIFRDVVRTGMPYVTFEKPFVYPEQPGKGVTYWDWSLLPVHDADGQVGGLILCLVDVTERKRLEREVVEAGEYERQRIGRDLHDGLGQNLAGVALLAQTLADRLRQAGSTEARVADEIADLIREASGQTRSLARGLCPVAEEPEGLAHALRDLADTTGELYDVACTCDCPEPVRFASSTVANHLYRIAQEAVGNAVRHGEPGHIVLRLVRRGGALVLTVEDDGRGLPPDAETAGGMGLRTMRHRAGRIGGLLEVRPRPGGGTVVSCILAHHPPAEKARTDAVEAAPEQEA